MPRKQNGFGNSKSFAVNGVNKRTDKGKGPGAAGSYPSNRRYGSTVTRSAIEQYDLDSTWARWRKGMEYYYQAAYLEFAETNAVLYQGTNYEIPVTFDGYRFATRKADSRTHYTIHRSIPVNKQLGFVESIRKDPLAYPDQFARNEIYIRVIATRDLDSDALLMRSVGERITDGVTAANINWVLTDDEKPASYIGKSPAEGSTVTVNLPLDEVRDTEFIKNNNGNLQALVGESVYMPDFYTERPITLFDQFIDDTEYFAVTTADFVGGVRVSILDTQDNLPPTLGEIQNQKPIYSTDTATGSLNGAFVFQKSDYQRFFGQQYLTADVVRQQCQSLAYAINPWSIQSIRVDEDNNFITLTSTPFQSTLALFTPPAAERWVVISGNSFTKEYPDVDADGNYNHDPGLPGDKQWRTLNTDVDPWQDEVFTSGGALVFADLYTCSCPAYLHAMIRSPEAYDERNGRLNRQQRAPMPGAKGAADYDQAGIAKAAGIVSTWASSDYKKGFKLCKHTIAAMFINKLRVQEPNTFPSYETRLKFDEKLAKDIREVAEEFKAQLQRSEITTVEIIYTLAEALNLDDVEIGYVLLGSKF